MGDRLKQSGPWLMLLAAFLLKTWEIWRHLASRHYALWGMLFDTLHMDWMSWWTRMVLTQPDQSLTYSTWLNAPDGAPTVMSHSLAGVHVALAGVLRLVLPGIVAHNLVALAGCGFTLVAIFLLLRHLSDNPWLSAGLAALVFTYGLGWAGTLPDLEVLFFGWAALALLAWLRYAEYGGWGRLILAALLVAWTAFTQMYYGLSIMGMLSVAVLAGLAGIAPANIPARRLWQRTLAVLSLGLALAVLAHLRNIVTTTTMAGGEWSFHVAPLPPNHLSEPLWRGLLMMAFVLVPLAVAWQLRLRAALLWMLMVLPLAILSLGEELGGIDMPLRYVRGVKPVLQRISFGFRFVAPVLLGLAVAFALFWRHRVELFATPEMRRLRPYFLGLLVAVFWLGAAFAPVIPRFEQRPFELNAIDADACSAPIPDTCTMTQRWVNRCAPIAGAGHPEPPSGALPWFLGQLLRPVRPQATMPLPEPPPCVHWLAQQGEEGSVLEFSRSAQNGYRAYFQTVHEKPLAAFPIRNGFERNVVPTATAMLPFDYQQGNLAQLPSIETLRDAGVGAVVLYTQAALAPCNFGIPQRVGLPPPGRRPDEAAFARQFGPPACEDEVMSVFWLGLGKANGGDTLAP